MGIDKVVINVPLSFSLPLGDEAVATDYAKRWNDK